MPIRWNEPDNPFAPYNLPPDYDRLTPALAKRARLNALEVQETPDDVVKAWNLFRWYYLRGWGKFYKRELPSPPMHYRWIYTCARWARNMIAAPRGFAKTTVMGIEWPVFLVTTRPKTDSLICFQNERKAQKRAMLVRRMIAQNPLIREDFGDMKGDFKGEERTWSLARLELANGSAISFGSVLGSNLGERPDYLQWDDVEPDPKKVKNWEQFTEDLIDSMFNVYLPMLEGGSGMCIDGTLLHRRSFQYWAMTTNDPRLAFFHRNLNAIVDKDGNPEWPEKYDAAAIEQLKAEVGLAAFNAQYMNNPQADDEQVLRYHPKRTCYEIIGEVPADPFQSTGELLTWKSEVIDASPLDPSWAETRKNFSVEVGRMRRIIVADSAGENVTERSDQSFASVVGIDREDNWFILDCWGGRVTPKKAADAIWRLGQRWKVSLIAVEAIGAYKELARLVMEMRGLGERPGQVPVRVKQLKYPAHLSKPVRIMGLEYRFDTGRIKIPNRIDGQWKTLLNQVQFFTPSLENLPHDDAVDTLAMIAYAVGMQITGTPELVDAQNRTLAARLTAGEFFDPETGEKYIDRVDPNHVDWGAAMIAAHESGLTPEERATKQAVESVRARLPSVYTLMDLVRAAQEVGHGDGVAD